MSITPEVNRLSALALIACDAAYNSNAALAGDALAPHRDSAPNAEVPLPPSFEGLGQENWTVIEKFNDAATGFGALIYRNDATNEVMVALRGTDGTDQQDWYNNLHLGMTQWKKPEGGGRLSGYLLSDLKGADGQPFTGKIHFTGQSLGGALAQYAAYDYAMEVKRRNDQSPNPIPNFIPNITLTTFNGLGASDGLTQRAGEDVSRPFITGLLAGVQTQHYVIYNDLVSRLGGDNLNEGNTWWLDFRAFENGYASERALSIVDSHRIESGFYQGFINYRTDFAGAAQSGNYLPNLNHMGFQGIAAAFGNLLNDKDHLPAESMARSIAGALTGLQYASQDEINELTWEVIDHVRRASDEIKAQNLEAVAPFVPYALKAAAIGPGTLVQVHSLLTAILLDATGLESAHAALVEKFMKPDSIDLAATGEFFTGAGGDDELYYKAAVAFSFVGRDDGSSLVLELGLDPDELFSRIASDGDWENSTLSYIADMTKAAGVSVVDSVLAATELMAQAGRQAGGRIADYAQGRAQALEDFVVSLAKGIGNAFDELVAKVTDEVYELGQAITSFLDFDKYAKAFSDFVSTIPGPSEVLKSAVDGAEQILHRAGQTPVLTPGTAPSPFTADLGAYDPNQVASDDVSEGHAKSFTLYLPYEAGEDGQSIKLTLAGASADKFSLLYQGQKIDLGSDGAFEVKVRAGTTQASFLLWELGDVDQDETLQIKAQLVDGNGQATHLEHVELNLALDAVDEIPPQFDRTIVGDLETIDTQPDAEGIQAGYDSLGNELVDADKPSPGKEDALFDSASNDLIQPGSGNDVVYALNGGNDLIEGGAGSDIVNGGAGDDRLYGGDEIDIAAAIERGDSAVGTGQRGDWLSGGLGDDTVVGGDGDDVLFGGGGSDLLIGGAGNDVLDGGDNYTATSFDWSVQTIQGNPFDRIFTPVSPVRTDSLSSDVGGDDVLIGGTGNDVLMGLQGNDYLDGGADDDVLAGNDGDDILLGGSGDDLMTGDYGKLAYDSGAGLVVQGNDYLDGGDGDDWIQGEGGQDELFGGTGNDLLLGDAEYLDGALHGEDYLDGEEGDDTLVGGGGNDELHGGDGNDSLEGDQSTLAGEYHGNDYLDGGDGDDTLNGQGGDDQLFGGAGNDLLKGDSLEAPAGADYLDGEEGNDTLIGGGGADTLFGGDGDDQLAGDSDDTPQSDHGNDYLDGGAGNDTLAGGAGDDTLIGGSGNDDLLGGEGNDIYRVNLGDGEDYLNDYDGANAMEFGSGISLDSLRLGVSGGIPVLQYGETDRIAINGAVTEYRFADGSVVDGKDMMALLTDPVNLAGSAGANLLLGGGGDDALWGEAGDDTLISGQGSDYLHGGDGRDVLAGGAGNDVLFGQEGDDDIQGGDGADQLVGGGGNDLLQGGAGADKLWGQAGDDTIEGGDGDDELIGGDGSDAMTGGRGDDWLWSGGTGAKTYVFNPGDGNDLVLSAAGDRHIRFGKPVFNRSQREPTTGGARLRIHRRAARLRGACCMF